MKRLLQLVVMMMMVFGVVSQAFPITIGVSLVGGESDKGSLGSDVPIPFTAAEVGLMSDSNNSTGFTYTTNFGELGFPPDFSPQTSL